MFVPARVLCCPLVVASCVAVYLFHALLWQAPDPTRQRCCGVRLVCYGMWLLRFGYATCGRRLHAGCAGLHLPQRNSGAVQKRQAGAFKHVSCDMLFMPDPFLGSRG
jgi:hypothetical protein